MDTNYCKNKENVEPIKKWMIRILELCPRNDAKENAFFIDALSSIIASFHVSERKLEEFDEYVQVMRREIETAKRIKEN